MSQNNLSNVVDFIKKHNTYSDFKIINNFISNLNFTKYRFNKNNNYTMLGGADESDLPTLALQPELPIEPTLGLEPEMPVEPTLGLEPVLPIEPALGLQPEMPVEPIQPAEPEIQEIQEIQEIPEIVDLDVQIDNLANEQNLPNENEQCVYKKITNPDGSTTTQKICGEKIITMPDMFLPKPSFVSSETNRYTIKKGTILYHSTVNKRGFDTKEIKLGKDKLISFFTPNFRLASDKIEGCSIDRQKGFIHVFEVKNDIPDIYIKLPYDTEDDLDLDTLKDTFCNGTEYYKGVGFFYPKNEIELFNNSVLNPRTEEMHENLDDNDYYSEFALCSPNDYLSYLYTQKCMSLRKLSQPYRFDGRKFN
jgi:hypothetical protein